MFSNPFAELSASVSPELMQAYVIVMILLVVGGTIFDVVHKKSAKYFFDNAAKAQSKAVKPVSGGDKMGIAIKTVASDVLTSSEFCNPKRRVAHLLGMYGFVFFCVATAALVFVYPTVTGGLPATLKGWLERVLVTGVAFELDAKTNKIKPAMRQVRRIGVVTTTPSTRVASSRGTGA